MVTFAAEREKLPEGLTAELAEWAYNLQFSDLSAEVVDRVKYMCLDFVGQAIGGAVPTGMGVASLGGSQPAINFAKRVTGPCTVMGTKVTTLPEYAALANGFSGCILALMDTHKYCVPTHLGTASFPAAFAASQMMTTDFPTFATAVVIGHEITAKLVMALQPGRYAIDPIPANTLGAALQTAKFFGLSKKQFVDCLGLGGHLTGALYEFVGPGYTSKMVNFGWQNQNGIQTALLVKEGQPGPPTIIEGPYGFLQTYSIKPDWRVLKRLGQPYEITRNGVKIYPVSRYMSAELDAILKLVTENDIQPQDVKQVVIEVPKGAHHIISMEWLKDPQVPEEARVSSYYWAAVAIVKRQSKYAWLDAFDAENFNSPQIRSLAQKVQCLHNPEFDKEFPGKYTTLVTIERNDGRTCSAKVDYPKGEPENPVSWEELEQRNDAIFNYCAYRVMTEERHKEIVHRIKNMEKEPDLGQLVSLYASNKE